MGLSPYKRVSFSKGMFEISYVNVYVPQPS